MKIFYLCDRRACESCNAHTDGRPECKHTTDVRHAKNFRMFGNDIHEVEAEQIMCTSEINMDGQVDVKELAAAIAEAGRLLASTT